MLHTARLAQSAERKALNLVVVGSSPTVGAFPMFRECGHYKIQLQLTEQSSHGGMCGCRVPLAAEFLAGGHDCKPNVKAVRLPL